MSEDSIRQIIDSLAEMGEDSSIPKNVKSRILQTINILTQENPIPLRISKALSELEEISEDVNMQPYTRTQIWNVVSMLEIL